MTKSENEGGFFRIKGEKTADFDQSPVNVTASKSVEVTSQSSLSNSSIVVKSASHILPNGNTILNYVSRAVTNLPVDKRPQTQCICTSCIAGMWFSVPDEVRCFCLRMRKDSWTNSRPLPVLDCDGWDDRLPEQKE